MRRILLIAFALALGSYVVWDRLEARWLREAIDAIAARGEFTSYAQGQPEPKTAEQREAASLYAQAAEAALDEDDNNRAMRLDVDQPGGAELPLEDIRANYPDTAPALQLLDRATPLDFGGFAKDQRAVDSYQQSDLERGLSTLAAVACLRADLASVRGDGDAAARTLVPCVRLKRTVGSPQYRSAIAQRILGSVRILFRHTSPSDAALADLQSALNAWPDADFTAEDVMHDRAAFIDRSRLPVYPGIVFAVGRRVLDPFALRSARRALERFDPAIALAREPWRDRWAASADSQRAWILRFRAHPPTFVDKLVDPYAPIMTAYGPFILTRPAYEIAARRLIGAALAAERYRRAHAGAPPSTLDLPEDPFSGSRLVLKHEPDAYVVYSVDSNNKDDGGILYGFGAAPARRVGLQSPRDFGIRVPLNPNRPGARP